MNNQFSFLARKKSKNLKKLSARYSRAKGASMLDSLLALVVVGIMTAGLAELITTYSENTEDTQIASYYRELAKGVTKYTKANYTTMIGSASVATPTAISFSSLSTSLPANFLGTDPKGATICLWFTKPSAASQDLEIFIVGMPDTGWNLPSGRLGNIISQIGIFAGKAYKSGGSELIEGVKGIWSKPSFNPYGGQTCNGKTLTGFTSDTVQVPVLNLNFSQAELDNTYLSKYAVPGNPDASKMFTAINMNGNDILSANTITASSITAGSGNFTNTNSTNLTVTGNTSLKATTTGQLSTVGDINATGKIVGQSVESKSTILVGNQSASTLASVSSAGQGGNRLSAAEIANSSKIAGNVVIGGKLVVDDIVITSRVGSSTDPNAGKLSSMLPTYSSRGAYAVKNGDIVTYPSDCQPTSGGQPKIIITPALQYFYGTPTGYFTEQHGNLFRANTIASGWSISITTNDSGNPSQTIPNNSLSNEMVGIAEVFCMYN